MRRQVTVSQIAAEVGLSQPAVSQVLNGSGRISEETRQKVLAAAQRMGYRPNAAAKAMITQKTRQVGVLILNNPADPFTFPLSYYTILGANMALESAGYVLCLVRIGDVEQALEGNSRVFREHVLDGVIVTTMIPPELCKAVEKLVPVCVWADTNIWRPTMCIRRDEVQAGVLAGEAIVRAGYRRAVWVTEDDLTHSGLHYSHVQREKGLRSVLVSARVEVTTVAQSWYWSPEVAKKIGHLLNKDTAVVGTDVDRTRMVTRAAATLGKTPGEDFGLVCCDSNPEIIYGWPDLARVEFDRIRLGQQSAEMMLGILEGRERSPKSVLLADHWVDGATIRPFPAKK